MQAAEKYEPSVIAKHSIHLAQAFNKYYAHVRILDEDAQKEARLALVYAVATVLKRRFTFTRVTCTRRNVEVFVKILLR